MTTLVRCKLAALIYDNAVSLAGVYEGSRELQTISENAIFGRATPAAWGSLGPDAAALMTVDEYYLDLFPEGQGAGDYILTRTLTRTFTAPCGEIPRIQYRYAAMEGDPVSLELIVANPAANATMADLVDVCMGVKLARGRRSDEEIALRQQLLDDWVDGGTYLDSHPEQYENQRAYLERKLHIAQGLDG